MALTAASKGILVAGVLVTLGAVTAAINLAGPGSRELVAPEAWASLQRGDAATAAAIFAREIEKQPRNAALHFGAGAAAHSLGRKGQAFASLRTAVELDPEFHEAQSMFAQIAYERGDAALAIAAMEKAVALGPRDRAAAELLERWRREASAHGSYRERSAAHFRILYEGGTQQQIGDRVAQLLEREYIRIGKALNSIPAAPVTVILYTNQEFHDITQSPVWAVGHYDGRIRMAVGGAIDSAGLDRLVAHELTHAVVASAAPRGVPAWLNEGLATYLEPGDRSWAAAALRSATGVLPLDALAAGFSHFDEQAARMAYAESAVAAEILHTRLGANIGAFLRLVGDGTSVDSALLEFQVQPNSFHAEWRRRVGLQ